MRPEIADSFSVEDACQIYYEAFCASARVIPLPKGCVAVSRDSLLCRCGNLRRRNPFACDSCSDREFEAINKLIEAEKKEKAARDKAQADKKKKPKSTKRPWKPKVMKAPKKRKKKC